MVDREREKLWMTKNCWLRTTYPPTDEDVRLHGYWSSAVYASISRYSSAACESWQWTSWSRLLPHRQPRETRCFFFLSVSIVTPLLGWADIRPSLRAGEKGKVLWFSFSKKIESHIALWRIDYQSVARTTLFSCFSKIGEKENWDFYFRKIEAFRYL